MTARLPSGLPITASTQARSTVVPLPSTRPAAPPLPFFLSFPLCCLAPGCASAAAVSPSAARVSEDRLSSTAAGGAGGP